MTHVPVSANVSKVSEVDTATDVNAVSLAEYRTVNPVENVLITGIKSSVN